MVPCLVRSAVGIGLESKRYLGLHTYCLSSLLMCKYAYSTVDSLTLISDIGIICVGSLVHIVIYLSLRLYLQVLARVAVLGRQCCLLGSAHQICGFHELGNTDFTVESYCYIIII